MTGPVFRFAPSPNGLLHLGHARSALINRDMATDAGGRFLLRIEDIDTARCTREFEDAICRDLAWLGIEWEEPVRRQSDHFDDYAAALDTLVDAGIAYPSFMSRTEIRAWIADHEAEGDGWPRDPDGVPLYPGIERGWPAGRRKDAIRSGEPFSWRLDIAAARRHVGHAPGWIETGAGPRGETGSIAADPSVWGDVVIARRETPTSYHLSAVVDDAIQGITHVVRGRDLFLATSVQRLLQELLGFPAPVYHHHSLVLGDDGRKLSKSRGDTGLAMLRAAGLSPADIRRMAGL